MTAQSSADTKTDPKSDTKQPDPRITETTRDALEAYRAKHEYSCGDIAIKLGYSRGSGSIVNKYLNGLVDIYDVARLEASIDDVLRAEATRRDDRIELQDLYPAMQVAGGLETIRKTHDVGAIVGPAGIGKTCGLQLYLRTHPSAILVTVSRWSSGGAGLEREVFSAVQHRGWRRQETRMAWLVDRFRGTDRLLIIDNAQRLTAYGREWIFDFHDATGMAISLVGNPDLVISRSANDQQKSRIGLLVRITLGDPREAARRLLGKGGAGDHKDTAAIYDLAERVLTAQSGGHMRALRKHLSLAHEFAPQVSGDLRKAFLSAHRNLVADYNLD